MLSNYLTKNHKVFAQGKNFDKLFLIFVICSMIGTLYEKILYCILIHIKTGKTVWASRTALIYGQFNIIYGLGAVFIVLLFSQKTFSNLTIFLCGSLFGGIFEYLAHFLQEKIIGTTSWNYSERLLNIGGRTTIPYMFLWGLLSVLVVKLLYPFLSDLIEKIPYNLGKVMNTILVIFFIFNMLISLTALLRQRMRKENIKPYTFIGKFCDKVYTDEYLKKVYPNMRSKKKIS